MKTAITGVTGRYARSMLAELPVLRLYYGARPRRDGAATTVYRGCYKYALATGITEKRRANTRISLRTGRSSATAAICYIYSSKCHMPLPLLARAARCAGVICLCCREAVFTGEMARRRYVARRRSSSTAGRCATRCATLRAQVCYARCRARLRQLRAAERGSGAVRAHVASAVDPDMAPCACYYGYCLPPAPCSACHYHAGLPRLLSGGYQVVICLPPASGVGG